MPKRKVLRKFVKVVGQVVRVVWNLQNSAGREWLDLQTTVLKAFSDGEVDTPEHQDIRKKTLAFLEALDKSAGVAKLSDVTKEIEEEVEEEEEVIAAEVIPPKVEEEKPAKAPTHHRDPSKRR